MTASYKISMVFRDGGHTPIASPQGEDLKPCLSDPYIQKLVKHFLKEANQTQGLLVIWGNGIIETANIIDATNLIKDPEEVENDDTK